MHFALIILEPTKYGLPKSKDGHVEFATIRQRIIHHIGLNAGQKI
jgi:hypothetical protein